MGTPNKYRKEMCETAIKVLSEGESLAAVCCELDITRETLRVWRDTHSEFRQAIKKGLLKAQRVWERIGRDGVEGNYEHFGAAPWIFTMKNRFRDDYTEDKDDKQDSAVSVLEKIITGEIKVKNDS
jgi:hypothetical protein